MTDTDLLLRAILIDPGDDLARLAYADALEESGRDVSRAKAIRYAMWVHRANATHDYSNPPEQWWDSRDVDWIYKEMQGATYSERGFARRVDCPLQAWLGRGGDVVRSHPVVELNISDRHATTGYPIGFSYVDDRLWSDHVYKHYSRLSDCLPYSIWEAVDRLAVAHPCGHLAGRTQSWWRRRMDRMLGLAMLNEARRLGTDFLPPLPWKEDE